MVYFVQAGDGGPIKIGYSHDPLSRMRTLQTAQRERLRLLGTIAGGRAKEREVHAYFANLHAHGEWFRFSQEIIDYAEYGGPIPAIPEELRKDVDAHPVYTYRTAPEAPALSPLLTLTPWDIANIAQLPAGVSTSEN